MKIKIKARLYTPGITKQYGAKSHPPIFEREFVINLTMKILFNIIEHKKFFHDGMFLSIRKVARKKKSLICESELSNISTEHFEKLKSAGWKLDQKAADQYNYPNDAADASLQTQKNRAHNQAQEIITLTQGIKEMIQ